MRLKQASKAISGMCWASPKSEGYISKSFKANINRLVKMENFKRMPEKPPRTLTKAEQMIDLIARDDN